MSAHHRCVDNYSNLDCSGPGETFLAPRPLTRSRQRVVITYVEEPFGFAFRLAESPDFEATPLLDKAYRGGEGRRYRMRVCCLRIGAVCAAKV